ncbi:Copia protein [Habropoda laboriosa]|uniref:Copia protein n=1 Tax=Habropoda laboriosa TaxID=597456 RepID=A0A0L7QJP7_9HYME|nr:Copia protein [Habropoda laboriosa]
MTGDYERERYEKNEITFLIDSGASDHLINREDLTKNFVDLNPPIKVGVAKNGCFILATKIGSLNVISNLGVEGVLKDVLYSAEVPRNLLSIPKLQKAKLRTVLDENEISIGKNGRTIATGKPIGNTFQIKFCIELNEVNSIAQLSKVTNVDYELWHQRLGHMGKHKFVELQRNKMVSDVSQIEKIIPNDKLCEACISGKQKRLPFNKVKDKSNINRPLFVIHSDVSGPITPPTFNNKNYFVLLIDEFTHYCVTYLITFKSDVFSVFRDYISKAEARFNSKIVNLY